MYARAWGSPIEAPTVGFRDMYLGWLFLKLFEGPTAVLLAAIFLSIVVWVLGNFK